MEEFISVTQAAERLGVNRARVHVYIDDGRLPAQKVGNQYNIRPGDLKRLKKLIKEPHRPRKNKARKE